MSGKIVQPQGGKGFIAAFRTTITANDMTHDLGEQDDRQDAGGGPDDSTAAAGDEAGGYRLSLGTLVPVSLVRSFYELSALDVDGKMVQFSRFQGRVTVVVNVATGDEHATREFTQMNEFLSTYGGRGLSILAFPCNQFGSREPWEDHEIPLCMRHVRPGRGFAPKFHLMGRCDVNGPRSHPVFEYLKQRLAGCSDEPSTIRSLRGRLLPPRSPDVRWNFEKFLVGFDGKPFKRFSSKTPLKATAADVENLLKRAAIAMQSSNRHGTNRFVYYDPSRDKMHKKKTKPSIRDAKAL